MGQLHVIFAPILCLLLVCGAGNTAKGYSPNPTDEELKNVIVIEYVDTDDFDSLLALVLTREDPLIIVQTNVDKPVWGRRLSRWINAWVAGEQKRTNSRSYGFCGTGGAPCRGCIVGLYPDDTWDVMWDVIKEATKVVLDKIIRRLDKRVKMLEPYELLVRRDENGLYQFIFRKRQ